MNAHGSEQAGHSPRASRPASGAMTGATAAGCKAREIRERLGPVCRFRWREKLRKILSAFAAAGNWTVQSRRIIVTMAVCLLVAAAFGPLLYRSGLGERPFHRIALSDDAGLKQALGQEQERANKLASDVGQRRGVNSRVAGGIERAASEAADREKAASERALVGARQALQLEQVNAEKLAGQPAEAHRDSAQFRLEVDCNTEQAKQANVRKSEQQAFKQERDKAEKLRVELAAARREGESRAAILRSASDEATRLKEASARATDELRQALRQAQDKAEKLAGELAAVRQEVEAQTGVAQAANDEARRAAETSKRSADDQGQALREAQGKAEKLAHRIGGSPADAPGRRPSVAGSAKDQVQGVKEAADRSAGRAATRATAGTGQDREARHRTCPGKVEPRGAGAGAGAGKGRRRGCPGQSVGGGARGAAEGKSRSNACPRIGLALEVERTRTRQQVEQQLVPGQEGKGPPAAARRQRHRLASVNPQLRHLRCGSTAEGARQGDVQQPTNSATWPTTNLSRATRKPFA